MSLKFSIMIASVALAAILAGVWLSDVYREHDSRAMLLPGQVITLFTDLKPLTAFALTDHKNRVFDLARVLCALERLRAYNLLWNTRLWEKIALYFLWAAAGPYICFLAPYY